MSPKRFPLRILQVGFPLLAAALPAQMPSESPVATGADPVAYFHSFEKHQVYLRDYSGDAALRYTWNGTALASQKPPHVLALAAIVVKSASWRADRLVITGERRILCEGTADQQLTLCSPPQPIHLQVDWTQSAMPTATQLARALFFPNATKAVAALPHGLGTLLPIRLPRQASGGAKRPICDCADADTPACDGRSPTGGATPPKLVKKQDPDMPDDLRSAHGSTISQVLIRVDDTGGVQQVWLTAPSSYEGANVNAVEAVSAYRFKPATCHDKPQTVSIIVDVNFAMR